jgi:hypothetical protein
MGKVGIFPTSAATALVPILGLRLQYTPCYSQRRILKLCNSTVRTELLLYIYIYLKIQATTVMRLPFLVSKVYYQQGDSSPRCDRKILTGHSLCRPRVSIGIRHMPINEARINTPER